MIPDEKYFCFEKTIYLFFTLFYLVCRAVCPWRTAIGAGGRSRPQKPEGCRCSEMHSQPYPSTPIVLTCKLPKPTYFFPRVRTQLFFSLIFRARLFFSKYFRARLFIFYFIHAPPPPPPSWISNGQCLT